VTRYYHPSWTDDGSFRAALDDVIIIPFVFVGLAASKILRFILSNLMRLFDYAFPLAMQLVWLPLFAGYRQAGIAGTAAFDSLERIAGLTSVVRWLRNAHVAKHLGVEKPTQKLRSFFSRWSIKFSVEYYEAKEQQAASYQPSDH
jgi:hypothetical protein